MQEVAEIRENLSSEFLQLLKMKGNKSKSYLLSEDGDGFPPLAGKDSPKRSSKTTEFAVDILFLDDLLPAGTNIT